jgi:hypothetical protein
MCATLAYGDTIPDPTGHYLNNVKPSHDTVIVFVNGIFGNDVDTWRNSNGSYWPAMIAKDHDFADADIYLYSFNSPYFTQAQTIEQLATRMLDYLTADGVLKHKHLVFLCHSMGGLITRQFLLKSVIPATQVSMIYFFATPSAGANVAGIAQHVSSNPQLNDMTLLDDNPGSYVEQLAEQWVSTNEANGPRYGDIPSYCAFEMKDTWFVRIVRESSAIFLCNRRFRPVASDHLEIVKPADERQESYIYFKAAYLGVQRARNVNPLNTWSFETVTHRDSQASIDVDGYSSTRGELNVNVALNAGERLVSATTKVSSSSGTSRVWAAVVSVSEKSVTVRYELQCGTSKNACKATFLVSAGIAEGQEVLPGH